MIAILFISLVSFIASLLTLFSGFGLGTLLMPVIALFLPVPVAVAITALVHLLNKVFKLLFLWRDVDRRALVQFGGSAMLAAMPGALLLTYIAQMNAIAQYEFYGRSYEIQPVKLVAGTLLILFASAERWPFLQRMQLKSLGLWIGGALSGFFGGLTGHQGAFRSAFLIKQDFNERAFIATNAAVAVMVDATRLSIYGLTFNMLTLKGQGSMIACAAIASFLGVWGASRYIEKVTMCSIQRLVCLMMYMLGLLLCSGII